MSVIIPAHNEARWIDRCLAGLLAQDDSARPFEVIVAGNGCTDETVALARARTPDFALQGVRLTCLDLSASGKPGALNEGDLAARGSLRAYLDADVVCGPTLLGEVRAALAGTAAAYATGRLCLVPPTSWATGRYADIWTRLPFVQEGTTGAGFFAVNPAGRQRWSQFPSIIADDIFVRSSFATHERVEVDCHYGWPLVEGFRNLVRVRRRQDDGVREVRRLYPHLVANFPAGRLQAGWLLRLAARRPISFLVYVAVRAAARCLRPTTGWDRGR